MVRFSLPDRLEEELRRELPDLDEAAREVFLVDLYRREHLSHHELGQALGLSRIETDALLKRHRVHEDLLTPAELEEQVQSASELRPR